MNEKTKSRRFPIRLVDGESMNALHPDTFLIPTSEERQNVISRDIVKVGFDTDDPECVGERMWVIVQECIPGEIYIGTLDNDPITLPLEHGCWVRFRPEHILDIYPN